MSKTTTDAQPNIYEIVSAMNRKAGLGNFTRRTLDQAHEALSGPEGAAGAMAVLSKAAPAFVRMGGLHEPVGRH